MGLISDATLSALRAVAESAMEDSASVRRPTETLDAVGGPTASYAVVATCACRVQVGGGDPDERVLAEKVTGRSLYVVSLPHDTDVRPADRIVVTPADPDAATTTYEVVGAFLPLTYRAHVRVLVALEA